MLPESLMSLTTIARKEKKMQIMFQSRRRGRVAFKRKDWA